MDALPLADAVIKGDLDAVKAQLQVLQSLGDRPAVRAACGSCEYGSGRGLKSVLHCAVQDSHVPILRLLLDAGGSVGSTDDSGNTGLHWAADRGMARSARVLLEAGADKHAMNNFGRTPEQKAAEERWDQAPVKAGKACIRSMFAGDFEASWDSMPEQAASRPSPIRSPPDSSPTAAAQATAVCGVPVPPPQRPQPAPPPEPSSAPPLVEDSAPQSLRQLVRADDLLAVETQMNEIRNAALGAGLSRVDAQDAVIAAITNTEEGDYDQRIVHSPLHMAASLGRIGIIQYCLAQGASPNKETDKGETPLHLAALAGRHECVLELLKAGGDPEHRNNFNRTPVELAESNEFDSSEMKYCKERTRIAFRGFNSKAAGRPSRGSADDLASTAVPESSRGDDAHSDSISVSIHM